jgi:hypothetical protein
MTKTFVKEACERYLAANVASLRWMLARERLHDAFLNTKFDPVGLSDREKGDVWRGPQTTYGWIQGRGLEALVRHAHGLKFTHPDLCDELLSAARPLALKLSGLLSSQEGRAAFTYDRDLNPVRPGSSGNSIPHTLSPEVATYSDIFVRKGLIAATHAFSPKDLPGQIDAFDRLVDDVAAGRFQMDEKAEITGKAPVADQTHYGPSMILLGAGGLFRHIGEPARAVRLGQRLVERILSRHLISQGLLCDQVGGDHCNPGHAIEMVGFALEALEESIDVHTASILTRILEESFSAGFNGTGLYLSVSLSSRKPVQPLLPWWSLPETIRAAALIYVRTGSAKALAIWQAADEAFFTHYWLGSPPVAIQMRDNEGPIDFAPATPDLDPGYHTGLSLLAAIEANR